MYHKPESPLGEFMIEIPGPNTGVLGNHWRLVATAFHVLRIRSGDLGFPGMTREMPCRDNTDLRRCIFQYAFGESMIGKPGSNTDVLDSHWPPRAALYSTIIYI
jgi:hypothetical protein